MIERRLAAQVGQYLNLSAVERAALASLETRDRAVRRGAVLIREHDPAPELFVLRQGMMMTYRLLDDGSRQILRFLFPGDVIGVGMLAYTAATETVAALADSIVHPIDRARVVEFAVAHPRLLLAFCAIDQAERAAMTDRMTGVGRMNAKARIAAVLLDLRDRQRRCDPAIADTFTLGLTQEEIGDATGLTAVHVNRMLRQLHDEGLIARTGALVTIRDEGALRQAAQYVDRLATVDIGWIGPPARG